MARRSKRKSSPRRQNNLSLTGVAQTYIVGSALSRATFGMDLAPFLLEGWATPHSKAKTTGAMVGMGSGWTQGISLAELVEIAVPGGQSAGINATNTLPKMMRKYEGIWPCCNRYGNRYTNSIQDGASSSIQVRRNSLRK